MGKTVTLEDYNTKCDNSVSNKQETKREVGKKRKIRRFLFYNNQLSLKTFLVKVYF